MIRPVPHIAAMSPYALAQLEAPAGVRLISLSQNESIRPPTAKAAMALARLGEVAHLYPDPDWTELREELSNVHGVPMEGILCSNGSMELIGCLTRAYADPHNAVLAPQYAYPFFRTATQQAHARFDIAPEDDCRVSVASLLKAVKPDTRIVFVANPANPTGTRIPRSELIKLRDNLSEEVLLVIDEAYGEFADDLNEPMFDLVDRGNVAILRTFSKAYGLAGMRVGWGYFPPDVASEIRKVMNPNNISVVGQVAALEALKDQAYMQETCAMTVELRDAYRVHLRQAGFDVLKSFTNFVLIRFASAEEANSAENALKAEGVILRAQGGVGLETCLRATVGAKDDLDLTARILKRWKTEARP